MRNTVRHNFSLLPEDLNYLRGVAEEKHLTVSFLLTQIINQLSDTGICDLDLIETNTKKRRTKSNR